MPVTCFSCVHFRRTCCDLRLTGYPQVGAQCRLFIYEPGSDKQDTSEAADALAEDIYRFRDNGGTLD